ncbi:MULTISPECIES: tetratricopeptide repeat protein [unclassified Solwaraspora]|uniref:tetratricopeptide repeat protein n=1 Tax=unclassified Solwaraspora TaxID=2627926 RepID=UPI00259BA725|nr:tetratricopeptide repeat protein [Solwaraspora sp. WMMA2056]WJK43079.1 tetratricopeptide repeat protein [Solwaraspora sp. WMMA2056]
MVASGSSAEERPLADILRLTGGPVVGDPPETAASVQLARGIALVQVHRYAEAVMLAEAAIDSARRVPGDDPEFVAELVDGLHTFSRLAAASGSREEALRVMKEAVALAEPLPEPDETLPRALNQLGLLLLECGRAEEGRAATERSVAIRRQAAEADPAALPGLATSLYNLNHHLTTAGLHAEALASIEEAVEIARLLADREPDTYLADLASALHNLSMTLRETGQIDRAICTVEEAIEIYHRLADRDPAHYLPELAESLEVMCHQVAGTGQYRAAAALADRCAQAYRAGGNPGAALGMRVHKVRYRLRGLTRRGSGPEHDSDRHS